MDFALRLGFSIPVLCLSAFDSCIYSRRIGPSAGLRRFRESRLELDESNSAREARSRTMIEIEQLCVQFGKSVAVDHLSLETAPGQIFGVLGPNGAGKTTTVRV